MIQASLMMRAILVSLENMARQMPLVCLGLVLLANQTVLASHMNRDSVIWAWVIWTIPCPGKLLRAQALACGVERPRVVVRQICDKVFWGREEYCGRIYSLVSR